MADENEIKDDVQPSDPGRRSFLKGVGLVGAGAAVVDNLLLPSPAEAASAQAASPAGGAVQVSLQINGRKRVASVETRTTLLNAMRDNLEPAVTGPKLVCDQGTCGACTVLIDDKPAYSCLVLAIDVQNKRVTTVEGLGTPDGMNPVQAAFVEHDATMCGFCTPGFVTTITAYLKKNTNPTREQIREACKGNFCRCGTYPKVFDAALAAATKGGRGSVSTASLMGVGEPESEA